MSLLKEFIRTISLFGIIDQSGIYDEGLKLFKISWGFNAKFARLPPTFIVLTTNLSCRSCSNKGSKNQRDSSMLILVAINKLYRRSLFESNIFILIIKNIEAIPHKSAKLIM